MKTTDAVVVVEAELPASLPGLWQALTDPVEMRQWYFSEIPDFQARVGFTTEFMVDAGERQFLHQWQVTAVERLSRLIYRWRYDGYTGAGLSVFELSAAAGAADASHLRLSFVVEQDFSADIPEFTRDACLGGWQYFITELGRYLAGR